MSGLFGWLLGRKRGRAGGVAGWQVQRATTTLIAGRRYRADISYLLAKDAEKMTTYKVIALRKLLLLKALHIEEQNNQRDVSLLAERLLVLEQIRQGCQDGDRLV